MVLYFCCCYQRWSPRGLILKSLALASKPLVLENCPVLGSSTTLFFELLKFCKWPEKNFWRLFFGHRLKKIFLKTLFCEHLRLCTCSLASSIPVLGLERVCPRKSCPWPWIFLCHWPGPRALCPRLHLRFLFFLVYCCYICSLNFSQKHFIFYTDAFYKSGYDIFFFCYSSWKQKRHSVYTVRVLQWWILHLLLNELNYVIYFSFFSFQLLMQCFSNLCKFADLFDMI